MPEYVEFGNVSKEHKAFVQTVLNVFSPFLEQYGFKKHRAETGVHFTIVVYRKDDLYIKISGHTFPDDKPFYYSLILGEGNSEDFQQCSKNSIPIWLLKNSVIKSSTLLDYPFPIDNGVAENIEKAREDLIHYGSDYLKGDLTFFRKIRNQQNDLLEF